MDQSNGHPILGSDQDLHEKLDKILIEVQSLRDELHRRRPVIRADVPSSKPADSADHLTTVAQCLAHKDELNDWQINFLQDIDRKLKAGRSLSPKQIGKVQEIAREIGLL